MDLRGEISSYLDCIVAFGSTFDELDNVHPISTENQFFARVNKKDLLRWKRTFQQALSSKVFKNYSLLHAILESVIKRIVELQSPENTNAMVISASSPIHLSGNAHTSLVEETKQILGTDRHIFLDSLNERNYNQALRRACTATDKIAVQLIKLLFKYEQSLSLNVNEQSGEQKYTALHHAARKKNIAAYDLLREKGADDSIMDRNGVTPSNIARENNLVTTRSITADRQ